VTGAGNGIGLRYAEAFAAVAGAGVRPRQHPRRRDRAGHRRPLRPCSPGSRTWTSRRCSAASWSSAGAGRWPRPPHGTDRDRRRRLRQAHL